MSFFTVDILTPERVVDKNIPANSLLIPTLSGQINVLPEHTHLIASLGIGQLSIFSGEEHSDGHFLLAPPGIVKISEDKITILARIAEEHHEIDREFAQLELGNIREVLSQGNFQDDAEREKLLQKLEMAELRYQMVIEFEKKQ